MLMRFLAPTLMLMLMLMLMIMLMRSCYIVG